MAEFGPDYLKRCYDFISNYRWAYSDRVLDFLVKNTLEEVPQEWLAFVSSLETRDLNLLLRETEKVPGCPEDLFTFFEKCRQLTLEIPTFSQRVALSDAMKRNLTSKKQHEVSCMSGLIHHHCSEIGISCIVDIGSGVGNLARVLNKKFNYSVLGIDANPAFVSKANHLSETNPAVNHIHHEVSRDSVEFMEKVIKSSFGSRSEVCVVGLHTCSKLAIDIARIYQGIEEVKSVIIVPCCYHKIFTDDLDGYFPLSESLIAITAKNPLPLTFLRLASQDKFHKWEEMTEEEHKQHSFNVLARSVLELFIQTNGIVMKKGSRHIVNTTVREKGWDLYLETLAKRSSFFDKTGEPVEIDHLVQGLDKLWAKYGHLGKTVESYSLFQVALQSVAESLVLADRFAFLKATCLGPLRWWCVMDERISPRSVAFVLDKSYITSSKG